MRYPKPLPQSPWRRLKDAAHGAQAAIGNAYGRPRGGMLTDTMCRGQRVIFIHNPKCGGTSLGKFFGVKRLSHSQPRLTLNERSWLSHFSVVVVRDPFERFLSSYYGNVLRGNQNSLTKRFGPIIHDLTPFEFLELLNRVQNTGPQTNWTHFPSTKKPTADLILKFEEIGSWTQQMEACGLDIGERTLLHHNKSEREGADHLERLKLSAAEFETLRRDVKHKYAQDYEAFEYC